MCAGPWPDRNWKPSVEQAESIMLNDAFIESLRLKLESHPIYAAVQTLDDLRVFMQHHVYSVWDFMSLIKYPQNEVAPARWPWTPRRRCVGRAFHQRTGAGRGNRHCAAGSRRPYQPLPALPRRDARNRRRCRHLARFVQQVAGQGIDAALGSGLPPAPSAAFTRTTFDFLVSGKPHRVAAALALGREHVIPSMFRAFLSRMAVTQAQAPQLPLLPQPPRPSRRGFPCTAVLASARRLVRR